MSDLTCERVDELADDLVLGHLDEPQRGRLLAHVERCPACRARVDGLADLVDRMLVLAPEHEPPAGFEARVLARIGAASRGTHAVAATAGAGHRRPPRRWLVAVVAAAALVVGALVGVAAGRTGRTPSEVARSGIITRADDVRVGTVALVRASRPYVLVTIDHPQPGGAEVYCDLQTADGRTVRVGSWSYDDVMTNVWAAGISADLLDAVGMQVVTEDGTVVASADLA